MSVRHLESLFRPASLALIGASDRPGSLGSVVLRNLRQGGFTGPIWAVNREHAVVAGNRLGPTSTACRPSPTWP
jgi:acetyltransferase